MSLDFFLFPSKKILSFLEQFGEVCPIPSVLVTIVPAQFIPLIIDELNGGVDIVYEQVITGWFLGP